MRDACLGGSLDALRERVQTSASILDSALDCIITIDGSGKICSFNPAAERTFGYRREQALGRELADLIIPEPLRERHREGLARLAEGGHGRILDQRLELEAQRADGERFPIELTVTRARVDPPLYAGFVRDISEQKRAEAVMREAEERYRALVEQIPTVTYVCAFDREGTILYISPQIEAIVGYPRATWTDDPSLWQRLIHPDDRERVLAEVARCYEEKEQFRHEYRMVAADGSVVWFRDEETLLLDDDGKPRYTQGVLIDITQEKDAERQLRLQHDLARVLAEVPTEEAALPKLLQVLGSDMDWAVGAMWVPEPGTRGLRCRLLWHAPGVNAPEFDRLTRQLTIRHGMGLPGVAWERGQPVTGMAPADEHLTLREHAARLAGLEARLAIPVMSGHELLAVIESFGTGPEGTDDALLETLSAAGGQIGQFIVRKRTEAELAHSALHDPLTGVANRGLLLDRLSRALARRRRKGAVALLFIDLDGFKLINDSHGHRAGDEVLQATAARLEGVIRPTDTVARIGGDEFVILLDDVVDATEAMGIAERVQLALVAPIAVDGETHLVTASIGISVESGRPAPEAIIRDADAAMYRAKEQGGGRYELFDEGMRGHATEHLRVERELRRAIEDDELRLHFQPLVSLVDGSLRGTEALVRWEHPERGLLAPGAFIPVAERGQLILDLGAWVLRTACAQASRWRSELGDRAPLPVHVNIAARQIAHEGLPQLIEEILEQTGVPAADLRLELTESALIEQLEPAAAALERLRELGVTAVLDDFGTGYSSLSLLQRLPVVGLKVDRSFVASLGGGAAEEGTAIVSAIVGMAKALGFTVVAEGVETAEQARRASELGCDLAQGFYFGRPVEAHMLTGPQALELRP
jgi:diguanylate cyclase (GGDEF)-like protein/PAS domain S-box-containing protein